MTVRFRPSTPEPAVPPTVGSGRTRIRINRDALVGQFFVGFLGALLLCWAFLLITTPDENDRGVVNEDLPPCATEDSTGCYWDADTRGNRHGDDVIDLGPDGVVEVSP